MTAERERRIEAYRRKIKAMETNSDDKETGLIVTGDVTTETFVMSDIEPFNPYLWTPGAWMGGKWITFSETD